MFEGPENDKGGSCFFFSFDSSLKAGALPWQIISPSALNISNEKQ